MPSEKTPEPSHEKQPKGVHTVEGHTVEIREREGNQELWVDGERWRFFVTPDGYTIDADAYAPPQKSLLDAVKNYLRTKPKIGHEH
jgi:hypothetical protein